MRTTPPILTESSDYPSRPHLRSWKNKLQLDLTRAMLALKGQADKENIG